MPSGPRSQRLIGFHSIGDGWAPVFVCPAGYVVLVKSAYFFAQNVEPTQVALSIRIVDGQSVTLVWVALAQDEMLDWSGWVALNPGDSVAVYAARDLVDIVVSGAVLFGPPPFPSA